MLAFLLRESKLGHLGLQQTAAEADSGTKNQDHFGGNLRSANLGVAARVAEHRRKAEKARQLAMHTADSDFAGQLTAHSIVHDYVADGLEQEARQTQSDGKLLDVVREVLPMARATTLSMQRVHQHQTTSVDREGRDKS